MSSWIFLSLGALLAVTSADVLSHHFIPSQNIASSASESHNAGTLYNQNSYARDDSKIRQHSTTLVNSAENTKDVATAISEPSHLAAIEALPPYYLTPAERLYPYYSLPTVEKVVPFLNQPAVEQIIPLYTKPVVEQVLPLLAQPAVEQVVPIYNPPAELTYPYLSLPFETAYPYVIEQGYYGFPTNVPYGSPAIGVPTETFYSFPTTGLLEAQQQIPISLPSNGVPTYQPRGFFGEALASPVEIIDTTLLEAFYPELPTQTHFALNNKFKTASASATPISASSESLSDNTAFSRDSFPILTQKKFAIV